MSTALTDKNYNKAVGIFLVLLLFLGLWMLPAPEGLSSQSWHLLAIFICTIATLMLNPAPMGVITIVSLTVCIVTKTITVEQALSGFSTNMVWLVVMAFFIARSIIKTGLGSRIAYYLISKLGNTKLGVAYAITLTEVLLAPAIPSAAARGGGIVYPIILSIIQNYGNKGDSSQPKKFAQILLMIGLFANVVCCTLFLTGTAANPITVKIASNFGIHISWSEWFVAAILPALCSLALLPLFFMAICKPEKVDASSTVKNASASLAAMGNFKWQEKLLLAIIAGMIILWSTEKLLGISTVTTAFLGLCLLITTGILQWNEVVEEKSAWDTLIWFGILLTIADMLTQFGVTEFLSNQLLHVVSSQSYAAKIALLGSAFFFMHYFFASLSAYLSVLYGPFLGAFIGLGLPPMLSALALAFMAILSSTLTHYGITPAIIYFQSGYFTVTRWWCVAGLATLFNLMIWLVLGSVWWRALGWI